MTAERSLKELVTMQSRRIRWLCKQIVQLASNPAFVPGEGCPPSCFQERACQEPCEKCWRLASLNAVKEGADD